MEIWDDICHAHPVMDGTGASSPSSPMMQSLDGTKKTGIKNQFPPDDAQRAKRTEQ
jgi:hypothetical protein